MKHRDIVVSNSLGIHARPAALIVKTAMKFNAAIHLVKDGTKADAKSIMSIMILAAAQNTKISIQASGSDEEPAVNAIAELFEKKFNEE